MTSAELSCFLTSLPLVMYSTCPSSFLCISAHSFIVDILYECPPELLSSEMRVIFQLMKISHFYEADDDESVSQ